MSPLYTYECQVCTKRFDELGTYDEKEKLCPGCDGTAKRVPSVPAPAQFRCTMPTYQRPKK